MRGIWQWYMVRPIWLRIVLAVVAVLVVLGIIGGLAGSGGGEEQAAVPASESTAALAQDVRTATPAPTERPVATPPPTPSPVPTPPPFNAESVARSIRDNRGFMAHASTDSMVVDLQGGTVTVQIKPALLSDTDALTIASQTAVIASRALWTTYPEAQELTVNLVTEFTDTSGQKSTDTAALLTVRRPTAERFDYDGLKTRVQADNKLMFCNADSYRIHLAVFTKIQDKGCLRSAVK